MPDNVFQQSFWDDDDSELWDDIAYVILEVYLSGVDGGIEQLPPELRVFADFDYVNSNALEFAKQYHYDKIRGITDTTRTQTQKIISDWIASGSPLPALETALEGVYGKARAERISQTESNRVYSMGNQQAWEATGLVEEWVWRTTKQDVCPLCLDLEGQHFGIGDIDTLPPSASHPGCRCWPQPVVSEEAFDNALDEIFS